MTNEQILKKAIAKAVENGFNQNRYLTALEIDALEKGVGEYVLMDWQNRYWTIIFSHDFAKAFWKNTDKNKQDAKIFVRYFLHKTNIEMKGSYKTITWWEYNLQQLMLEKEPLKYLEQFIK